MMIAGIGDKIDFLLSGLEPFFNGLLSSLNDGVVFLVQPQFAATVEKLTGNLLLIGSEDAGVFASGVERVGASLLLDF
jgi:hypothetical protein